MKSILIHFHVPTREDLRDLLTRLGHVVIYEDRVASRPKILEDAVLYQPDFIVAEEPEYRVRESIQRDFDRHLSHIPIVWLPSDYWQFPWNNG